MEAIPDLVMLKADETTLPVTAHIYQNICVREPFRKASFSAFHQVASVLFMWMARYWKISEITCVLPRAAQNIGSRYQKDIQFLLGRRRIGTGACLHLSFCHSRDLG